MIKICIPENLIDLTDAEFAVLAGVSICSGTRIFEIKDYASFSIFNIGFALTGKIPSKSIVKSLRSGVGKLKEKGIIFEITKGYYTLNTYKDFDHTKDKFILIPVLPIKKIINMESDNIRSISLLHYFGIFISTFDHVKNIGYMPLSYISKRTGKSLATINKYNKILLENELIGVIHGVSDDKLARHNVYYLPGYFENAREYARSRGWLRTINSKKAI